MIPRRMSGRIERRALALAIALMVAVPAQAAGLSEAQVRGLVAAQQAAWNGRAVDRFFALFTADAAFADRYRTPAGKIVPYGRSTRAQAMANSRRFLAKSKSLEAGQVTRVALAPDARSAVVVSQVTTRVETAGKVRTLCAERSQTMRLEQGRALSEGQTDTFVNCPRRP